MGLLVRDIMQDKVPTTDKGGTDKREFRLSVVVQN
jgi:hypothetical protein